MATTNKPAEDWVPVRAIQNGMILLDNGFLVTGVKIEPKNIFILDQDVQNNVIFSLRTFYNTLLNTRSFQLDDQSTLTCI